MARLWLIPLVLGYAIDVASAFTTVYSRWWGERRGTLATVLLRNVLGIPVWVGGLVLAVRSPSPALFRSTTALQVVAWLLLALGAALQLLAVAALRRSAAAPSLRDTLVRAGPYARIRHPIYAGALLQFPAVVLVQPRLPVLIACGLGVVWAVVQARCEERDLCQRLADYREYMAEVPRFVPRVRP